MWIFSREHLPQLCNCVSFFQVALKLTQMKGPSREFRQPLLDVIIRNMHADVVDRKWDTQGSVTMGTITVLDYITVGMCVYSHPRTLYSVCNYMFSSLPDPIGEPTCLLKTEALNDGNFITTRFVTVSSIYIHLLACGRFLATYIRMDLPCYYPNSDGVS